MYYSVTTYKIASAVAQNPKIPVEFDGFTKLIQAKAPVVPGQLHTLEICIADASDLIYDSGVLIETGSFQSHESPDFVFGQLSAGDYYFELDTIPAPPFEQSKFIAQLPPGIRDSLFPPIIETAIPDTGLTDINLEATLQPPTKHTNLHYVAHYPSDIYTVQEEDKKGLDRLLNQLEPDCRYEAEIIAFTDQDASVAYNQRLSEKRAAGIASLIETQFPANVIIKTIDGKGIHSDTQLTKAEKRSTHITFRCLDNLEN